MTRAKQGSMCIDCFDVPSYRKGERCHECSVINQRQRLIAFTENVKANPSLGAQMKARKAAKDATRRAAKAKLKQHLAPHHDTDIALYRSERLAKMERGPATRAAQILHEVALQIRTEQPKVGRPRKAA